MRGLYMAVLSQCMLPRRAWHNQGRRLSGNIPSSSALTPALSRLSAGAPRPLLQVFEGNSLLYANRTRMRRLAQAPRLLPAARQELVRALPVGLAVLNGGDGRVQDHARRHDQLAAIEHDRLARGRQAGAGDAAGGVQAHGLLRARRRPVSAARARRALSSEWGRGAVQSYQGLFDVAVQCRWKTPIALQVCHATAAGDSAASVCVAHFQSSACSPVTAKCAGGRPTLRPRPSAQHGTLITLLR